MITNVKMRSNIHPIEFNPIQSMDKSNPCLARAHNARETSCGDTGFVLQFSERTETSFPVQVMQKKHPLMLLMCRNNCSSLTSTKLYTAW